MTTLQTEKVTLTGQVLPDRIGEATFWIVYPLTFANCRQVEDRIARDGLVELLSLGRVDEDSHAHYRPHRVARYASTAAMSSTEGTALTTMTSKMSAAR